MSTHRLGRTKTCQNPTVMGGGGEAGARSRELTRRRGLGWCRGMAHPEDIHPVVRRVLHRLIDVHRCGFGGLGSETVKEEDSSHFHSSPRPLESGPTGTETQSAVMSFRTRRTFR